MKVTAKFFMELLRKMWYGKKRCKTLYIRAVINWFQYLNKHAIKILILTRDISFMFIWYIFYPQIMDYIFYSNYDDFVSKCTLFIRI